MDKKRLLLSEQWADRSNDNMTARELSDNQHWPFEESAFNIYRIKGSFPVFDEQNNLMALVAYDVSPNFKSLIYVYAKDIWDLPTEVRSRFKLLPLQTVSEAFDDIKTAIISDIQRIIDYSATITTETLDFLIEEAEMLEETPLKSFSLDIFIPPALSKTWRGKYFRPVGIYSEKFDNAPHNTNLIHYPKGDFIKFLKQEIRDELPKTDLNIGLGMGLFMANSLMDKPAIQTYGVDSNRSRRKKYMFDRY